MNPYASVCVGTLGLLAIACGSVSSSPDAGGDTDGNSGTPDGGEGVIDAAVSGFSLSAAVERVDARVPDVTELEVAIERDEGFSGAVVVQASDLPSGVTSDSITIAEGSSSGILEIDAGDGTPGTVATVTLTGSAGDLTQTADVELFLLGPAGSLDTSFGDEGQADVPEPVSAGIVRDMTALPDGRVAVTGDFEGELFVVVFRADGSLDEDFGDDGTASVSFAGAGIPRVVASSIIAQEDAILVAGFGFGEPTDEQDRDVALARLGPDGSLDTSFAGGGLIVHRMGSLNVQAGEMALDAEGRIVMSVLVVGSENNRPGVARFTASGLVDTDFGDGGIATSDSIASPESMAVSSTGEIVQAARSCSGGFCGDSFLLRYLADGTPDTDFGTDGRLVLDGRTAAIRALDGGAFLLAVTEDSKPGLNRRDSSVALDPSFGDDGKVALLSGDATGSQADLVIAEDGRPVSLGSTSGDILLARLTDTDAGDLDESFGTGGVVTATSGGGIPRALALRTPYHLVVLMSAFNPLEDPPYGFVRQYWN